MKTIKFLAVAQDGNDAKWPDGAIRNETEILEGTPVIKEIYNDIIANIYKIITDAGIAFTQDEDSEQTQHQLLDALKVFVNKTNDIQQLLTVAGTDITSLMNFDNFSEDYVFVGKVTEDILASQAYTILGAGGNSYSLTTTKDIPASSVVLVTLNSAGSQMISISSEATASKLHTALGIPISYNDSKDLLYFVDGDILTDFPKVHKVQEAIQANQATGDIKVLECVLIKGKLICFTFNDVLLKYQAFSFDSSNLNVLEGEIAMPDLAAVDNQPYMYSDGEFLYFTNTETVVNESVNDYALGKFSFDENTLTIAAVSFSSIDNLFLKTTNAFIDKANNDIYTFVEGNLHKYDIGGAARVLIGFFNIINGVVFKFESQTYYSNGNLASKWNY